MKRYKVGDRMKPLKIIVAVILIVSMFGGATILYNHLMSEEKESNIAKSTTAKEIAQVSDDPEESRDIDVTSESIITTVPPAQEGRQIGNLAYDFTLIDEKNNSVTLSSFRGKHVIVSFWIYGCSACYAEFPEYQKLHDKLEQDQIENVKLFKVYINPENASTPNISDIRQQLDNSGYTFPTYWDKGDVATNYGIYYVPHTFVIDPDGLITASIVGTTSYEALAELVGLEE
ncbi:MAG: TlpA family protein disulfide reductase [Clostridiaceae bacterium]|nr:TlpA family protein disulfide reductase [Clostridiaceae bacterium]